MFPDAPYLWELFVFIGLVAGMAVFFRVAVREGMSGGARDFYFKLILVSVGAGMVFGMVFQFIYDLFENGAELFALYDSGEEAPGTTFLGGLLGGCVVFLIGNFAAAKPETRRECWIVLRAFAPALCAAHFFGRIGCFMAGCCYGEETHGFLGVWFPAGSYAAEEHNAGAAIRLLPTQLIEAAFLLALFCVCVKLIRDSFIIYLFSYGIFRFIIEFFRWDDRGSFLWQNVLSPSQIMSLAMLLCAGILLYVRMKYGRYPGKKPDPQSGSALSVNSSLEVD
jgi:phosphatidylglycerol:prolipoprotein diacylglycerol transferase